MSGDSRYDFEAIGTRWSIETPGDLSPAMISRLQGRIDDFDRTYSRFRPDSRISRFAAAAGVCELPDDALPMLNFYRTVYEATAGRVSPLVGQALEHLGYGADYSLHRRSGPSTVPEWDDVLRVDGSTLISTRPVLLDFGAAGKGYLVDILAALLAEHGIDEYLIDASGDIAHRGSDLCRVGLEHPADPTQVVGVANLGNAALCASATNRRSWGAGLHHIIDPTTGEPTNRILAAWVVADSTMVADGLATAMFLAEPTALAGYFRFSYVRMPAGGGVEYSRNFDGELFT